MPADFTSIARPAMRAKARGIHSDQDIPRPVYSGPARTPGVYPDRVLLLGNGALAGWGVRSHDDAIPGHLARELTSRTEHASEVHLVVDHTATVATVAGLTGGMDLNQFDAIVTVVGASDALQLLPVPQWSKAVAALIEELVDRTVPSVEIIMVAIQPPSTVPVFNLTTGGVVDHRATMFNTITRTSCAGRVHLLDPPVLSQVGPTVAGQANAPTEIARVATGYHEWARSIAQKLFDLRPAELRTGPRL